eukprot:CAMPEP_0170359556 /NCGR_PEP_ID=MMETSP0117_2-20130122/2811_1 /TAXON_ID=400756 /ORGANISM="Durinskia baltica, Strain CSIRO CS-38" /LENGTH=250 /DNA_ID=CAMNT_0010613813 /DNA_START=84 /DNA_END=832 /DNA_ORIENTATION=-
MSPIKVTSTDLEDFMKMWEQLPKSCYFMNMNVSELLIKYKKERKERFGAADWTAILESINEKVRERFVVAGNTFEVKGEKIKIVKSEAFVKRRYNLGAYTPTRSDHVVSPEAQAAASGVPVARSEENEGEKQGGEKKEEASRPMVWPDTLKIKQLKNSGRIKDLLHLRRLSPLIARLFFDKIVPAEEVEEWLRGRGLEVGDLWWGYYDKERNKTLVTLAFRSPDSKERCMAIPLGDRKEFGCIDIRHYRP